MEDAEMDELKVYNRQLSKPEIDMLYRHESTFELADYSENQLLEHYLYSGYNEQYNLHIEEITEIRQAKNLAETDQIETMVMNERQFPRKTFVLDRGVWRYTEFLYTLHVHFKCNNFTMYNVCHRIANKSLFCI